MRERYLGEAMAAIHETADGVAAAGLMDKPTLRKFDENCLAPAAPPSSEKSRALPQEEGASQAVFVHRRS